MSAYGIDVSDFQGNVNWRAVAEEGFLFAIIKATEGASFVAETFASNWARSKAAGLIRGAYHFFRPSSDPQAQAEFFLRVVKLEPYDLPPVLDVETTGGMGGEAIASRMAKWLQVVENATGRMPIIYTNPGFWQRIGNLRRFSEYPLWIAHYTNNEEPYIPGGWDTWTFWQYTDSGRVRGVSGSVDINRFQSSLQGKSNSKVMLIQKCLKNKGFAPGASDGVFGESTKLAVISFQKAMGWEPDGIVGIKTWVALMDPFLQPIPQPEPIVQPQPPVIISLLEVCKSYKGFVHQDDALDGLQEQIPLAIIEEFSQKWRNTTYRAPVRLINVCKSYQGLPHQEQALLWLQQQIPPNILENFAQKWRSQSISQYTDIRLINVCRSYQGKAHQVRALLWLQQQIPSNILREFANRWRNATASTAPIHLINVCKFYQGKAHQHQALEWLQLQINESTLAEFARLWRIGSG
ncbi:MAG: GH25 family lysozyme [Oscillatoriaceae bacterium SKW80]|nr:peptidoglycan-binding protein [Oscillatoriaceae bacterium SKYG93]MCX8121623.1 GH25 family lysozyme [Oscillatoriaceae bacterium SKW80]MDW8453931.1 GH25 family lysozyme [Oscillatoriaceae cyanobacterium SKYGB_i_bin93]HIK28824.1 peptidoglycan-binding protein [Oscillatoriaceae cyanobacterium M7585_C2015_266]